MARAWRVTRQGRGKDIEGVSSQMGASRDLKEAREGAVRVSVCLWAEGRASAKALRQEQPAEKSVWLEESELRSEVGGRKF